MAVNKNQLAGKRGQNRAAFYQGDKDCLPCYNYSNGAGWKTKVAKKRQPDFRIKRIIPASGRATHYITIGK